MKEFCKLKIPFAVAGAALFMAPVIGIAAEDEPGGSTLMTATGSEVSGLTLNEGAWNYDAANDVYWQIGIVYCTSPATTDYETMGIYVPGAYMTGVANGDGTYTCTVNAAPIVNGYTADTAPIVIPVNTAGYSAQTPPTSYSYNDVSSYIEAGFIYVFPGLRGRANGYDESNTLTFSGGAPWGVTDLKAAIRYYRYNKDLLPGDEAKVFVFGHSGGGAQSSVAGACGDSNLYYDYLKSIGAAMTDADGNALSDAVYGVQAWCPITSLDMADEAYEWNMGQYASSGTRATDAWTSALSADLAESFAKYVNHLGLVDEEGNALTLSKTETGIYTAGTYYDYLLAVINQSLNNFLSDTTFPYTPSTSGGAAPGGEPSGDIPEGEAPDDLSGDVPADGDVSGDEPAGDVPADGGDDSGSETEATTYETVQDYIDALNSDVEWVTYDAESNTAAVSSVEAFVQHMKSPTKDVPAFDDLSYAQAENSVFGNDSSDTSHFDPTVAAFLYDNQSTYAEYGDWDISYVDAYASDLKSTDALGHGIPYRMNMYNPMYYLLPYYAGYGTSNVAVDWRINTGIEQGDTANTVEMNLALALESLASVESVSFTTVWELGHTQAERTGDATSNFISWVNSCTMTGWHYSSVYGWYYQFDGNWIYSWPNGYMYVIGDSTKSLYIYTYDFGWIWTGDDYYSFFYSYDRDCFFYYAKDSMNPRRFYNCSTGNWFDETDSGMGFDE